MHKTPEASSKKKISLTFTFSFIGQKLPQFEASDSRQVPESLPFVMVDVP
jgi:hypothetical protein